MLLFENQPATVLEAGRKVKFDDFSSTVACLTGTDCNERIRKRSRGENHSVSNAGESNSNNTLASVLPFSIPQGQTTANTTSSTATTFTNTTGACTPPPILSSKSYNSPPGTISPAWASKAYFSSTKPDAGQPAEDTTKTGIKTESILNECKRTNSVPLLLNSLFEYNTPNSISLCSPDPGPISGQWDSPTMTPRNLIGEPSVKFLESLPDYQESNLDKYDGIGEDDEDELKWRECVSQMKTFIEIHDHSNVPFKEYPMLYEWALQQRCLYMANENPLPESRIQLLLGIQFNFNFMDTLQLPTCVKLEPCAEV